MLSTTCVLSNSRILVLDQAEESVILNVIFTWILEISTAYGLEGPGMESRWGEIFRTCPDRPWGPPSLLYNGYRVFPGGKVRPRRDADPSPPSSAEVKNRVELYLYSP